MDFVADVLVNGRRIRVWSVVGDFTRECLATEVDPSLPGLRVALVLDRIVQAWRLDDNTLRPHSALASGLRRSSRNSRLAKRRPDSGNPWT